MPDQETVAEDNSVVTVSSQETEGSNPPNPQSVDQSQDVPAPEVSGNGAGAAPEEGSGGAPADASNIREPDGGETTAINTAEAERASALSRALQLIDALLAKRPPDDTDGNSGAPVLTADDQKIIDAAGRWLFTTQLNSIFWDTLGTARGLIAQNQALSARPHVDTVKNDFAYVYGQNTVSQGVFFCMPFFNTNSNCRREVITHEYFHFLGLGHFYTTTITSEALQCAHHMAELVFDIATGCTLGCGGAISVCRP